jgi:hypothetical protein
VIALCDTRDGPFVESTPDSLRLVHGAAIEPLADLEATCRRYAALHWTALRCARAAIRWASLRSSIALRTARSWLASEIHALLGLAPDSANIAARSRGERLSAPLDEETGWEGILRVLPAALWISIASCGARYANTGTPASRFGTYRARARTHSRAA